MQQRGINKRQLAEIAGVGTSAVTKWAQGGAIRITQLKKIADFFGVDISVLAPSDITLEVKESENSNTEYWKKRALLAEGKLTAVEQIIGKSLKCFEELQEIIT
jgi:transcriptional regulator with XRE-family HTH domain